MKYNFKKNFTDKSQCENKSLETELDFKVKGVTDSEGDVSCIVWLWTELNSEGQIFVLCLPAVTITLSLIRYSGPNI